MTKFLTKTVIGSLLLAFAVQPVSADIASPDAEDTFNFLDMNSDGTLNPYEVLDALLVVQDQHPGKKLTFKALQKIIQDAATDRDAEVAEFMSELDQNKDGKLTQVEAEDGLGEFAETLDKNRDNIISVAEFRELNFADAMLATEEELRAKVDRQFGKFDENRNGFLTQREVNNSESWGEIFDQDLNGDHRISKDEMLKSLTMDSSLAQFKVSGNKAIMFGLISADTPSKVLELLIQHPEVRTIEMIRVPGSVDDDANLRAATYVREFGLNTVLKSHSMVASGGTDFFLAGLKRTVEPGALVGIHSWGGAIQGKDVPKDDPQHQLYLKFYKEMGIPGSFYWRTLEAAPADGIHWMSEAEFKEYKFRTN